MKLLKGITLAAISLLMVACYPEKERTIEDFDIVGTIFADDIIFQDYKTFYLYDSLVIVYDTNEEAPDYPVEEANLILSTIRTNMINYGWVELTRDSVLAGDTPDVYLEASAWNSKIVGAIYYPGWGYPWWGYPGWGYPGYPWYPGGATYYSYTTGTVKMFMMDVKNYPYDDTPPQIMWEGGLNGILSNSSGNNLSRVEVSINKAFNQSPYLKLNN